MTPRRLGRLVALALLLAMVAPMAAQACPDAQACGPMRHGCGHEVRLAACCCSDGQAPRGVTAGRAVAPVAVATTQERPSWALPVPPQDATDRGLSGPERPLRPTDRLALFSVLLL